VSAAAPVVDRTVLTLVSLAGVPGMAKASKGAPFAYGALGLGVVLIVVSSRMRRTKIVLADQAAAERDAHMGVDRKMQRRIEKQAEGIAK
jgi:hypothetical protein